MNLDQSEGLETQIAAGQGEPRMRRPWAPPCVSQLKAGSAEAIIGTVVYDGTVEMVGS